VAFSPFAEMKMPLFLFLVLVAKIQQFAFSLALGLTTSFLPLKKFSYFDHKEIQPKLTMTRST
jgi:hypothetical protein